MVKDLIIEIETNQLGAISTTVKWGEFKYTWYGKEGTYWAMRFCNRWFSLARKIKITYKES